MPEQVIIREDGSRKVVYICDGESLTRQSERDQSDINKIVARFDKTGVIPLDAREGQYLDVSEVGDYRSALHQVMVANEYFSQLPANVRAEFENDPARFLDFVVTPGNEPRLRELGVLVSEVAPTAPVAAPQGPPAPPGGGVAQ